MTLIAQKLRLAIKELSEGEQSSDTDNIIKYSAERLEKSLNFSDDTTIQEELLYASATGVREVVVDEKLGEKAGEKKDEKAG